MTANQINYAKLQEERRSNLAKEGLTRQANAELMRSNLANESIRHAANEEAVRHNTTEESLERQRNTLNYNASIYGSDVSKRNAELAYQANIYGAQSSYAASTYASQLNYQSTMASIDQRNEQMWVENRTNRYKADLDYEAKMHQADIQEKGLKNQILNGVFGALGDVASTVALPIMFGA